MIRPDRRWIAPLLLIALAGAASAQAPPDELEGIALGAEFSKLNRRFRLRDLVPLTDGQVRRYILDPRAALATDVRSELDRRALRRLELVFDGESVFRVRAEYSDRQEVRFDEMERRLAASFGPPTRIQDTGPMQVGRNHGIRLFLWIRLWTWEADGRSLTVEGEHYGDDKKEEAPDRHTYTFTLETSRDGPEKTR